MSQNILDILSNFLELIVVYFMEIWDFLLLIGFSSAAIIILFGAILEGMSVVFVSGKKIVLSGRKLILSGIILIIICEYFVLFPPF